MDAVTDGPPDDHAVLVALNAEIAAESEGIVDLERRILAIEVEVASWRAPPAETTFAEQQRETFAPWVAFLLGLTSMALLGAVVGVVIGR